MISISPSVNNSIDFKSNKTTEKTQNKTTSSTISNNSTKNIAIPTLAMLMYMNALSKPIQAETKDDISDTNVETVETVNDTMHISEYNPTALSFKDLINAPNPLININGKNINAGIVVDVNNNKLYRYTPDGEIIDGYHVATGILDKNGKSITDTGIRQVDHIETYPYKSAVGTKRKRNPKAYGPNILYLTIVNPKTGEILGSNGEFIHGNNNPASIGTHASHGCVRMDNEVIQQFAKEVPVGSYVLIK